jgi:hypothetical protein
VLGARNLRAKRLIAAEERKHADRKSRVDDVNRAKQEAYDAQVREHQAGVEAREQRRQERIAKAAKQKAAAAQKTAILPTATKPAERPSLQPAAPVRKLSCPSCGASYESAVQTFCPSDGTKLV